MYLRYIVREFTFCNIKFVIICVSRDFREAQRANVDFLISDVNGSGQIDKKDFDLAVQVREITLYLPLFSLSIILLSVDDVRRCKYIPLRN